MHSRNKPVIGQDVKTSEGIFLSWFKLAVILLILLGLIFVTVFLMTFRNCTCSLEDIQEEDEADFWEMCLDESITRNQTIACLPPPHVYRLPRSIIPSHYDVTLRPYFYNTEPDNFTLNGHVDMFLTCLEETDIIMFHMVAENTSDISVVSMVTNSTPIGVISMSYDEVTDVIQLGLSRLIGVEEELMLSMDYLGNITTLQGGIYYGSYWDEETDRMEYYLAADNEPYDARRLLPCFDEPEFKATYNATIWRQDGYKALSNMPLASTEDMGNGWFRDQFEESVPMSSYLFCVAISKFDYIETWATGGLSSKHVRYWAPREMIAKGLLNHTFTAGNDIFNFFEQLFDMKYSLPKLDSVVSVNHSGAMENWGLIMYSPTSLTYDPAEQTTQHKVHKLETLAHELAHQWLGNIFTCEWWEGIWLQEGFATYYSKRAVAASLPEYGGHDDLPMLRSYILAIDADDDGAKYPLHMPVSNLTEVRSVFSIINYIKGSAIVRMMTDMVEQTTFDNAMRRYIRKMKYKNVRNDNLFAAVEEALKDEGVSIGTNFTECMNTWVYQMGFPIVTFHRTNGISSTVQVTQTIYLRNDSAPLEEKYPSEYSYAWTVPLTYVTSKTPDWEEPQRAWLIQDNRTLTLPQPLGPDDWIVGNIRQVGYYLVNYDRLGWEAIIKQLNTDHTVFNPMDRAQFIRTAFKLNEKGMMSLTDALRLTEFLENEQEYLAHSVIHKGLDDFLCHTEDTPAATDFRMYIRKLVEPHYRRIGWDKPPNELLAQINLRRLVVDLACKFEIEACINEAKKRYADWMADPEASIDPDIKDLMLENGIRYGNEEEWYFAYERFVSGNDTRWEPLASTTKPWLISSYLDLFMASPEAVALHVNESREAALLKIIGNPVARPIIWQMIDDDNWGPWMESVRVHILRKLTMYASRERDVNRVRTTLDHWPDTPEDARSDIEAILEANMKWEAKNMAELTTWLKQVLGS